MTTAAPLATPAGPHTRSVHAYDFRRPRRLSAEQMRSIQRLHAQAAETIQARLGQFLGVQIEARLESAEEVAYGLFLDALGEHTYGVMLDLAPLPERGLLAVDSALCLAFVERCLGGACKAAPVARSLTAIDQAAAEPPLEMLLRALREAWKDVCPMKLTALSRHNDPRQVSLIGANEPVLSVTLRITGGLGEHRVRLCAPIGTMKHTAAGGAPRAGSGVMAPEKAEALRTHIMESVEKVSLRVDAIIGHAELPIGQLLVLAPGDVIALREVSEHPVLVKVGGTPAFHGKMGLQGRRKAVRVIERIDPREE
jgi:flagellar motor switch protein FliM